MNKWGRMLAVKYSNQIVTLTEADKKCYIKRCKKIKAKIEYIYNPSTYQDAEMHLMDSRTVISIGRLTYQKGFDRMLNIWEKVEQEKDWDLVIIGDGEKKQKL